MSLKLLLVNPRKANITHTLRDLKNMKTNISSRSIMQLAWTLQLRGTI
jgi:hypothetical protein